ncbi:MAG: indolepyruvate ferredoxin oxidoreductase family protein [Candidatus Latescibacterota bacterium]|nr:indolepyruvate ferredoxin oxidoreductase family protein [Candidatus Latescibacterota bacterium]
MVFVEPKPADKFRREQGPIFLTGVEAVVRLLTDKQRTDQASGGPVNQTFITGYEGSPLGGLDLKVVQQLDLLNELGVTIHHFGINEKTAASAALGAQYAPSGDVDSFWYGKAHGAMWIPDEAWLANLAGTGNRGSMVLLCGEDHRSKSSVSPGTSDWALRSSLVPVFYPATVSEILELGMHAILLSRYLGIVTALKLVTPVCDGASTVDADTAKVQPIYPEPFDKRFHPIVMALGALPMQRELVERKVPLTQAYIRANGLNLVHNADAGGSTGIVTTGKSYTDVRQALDALGRGVPILQLRVSWPLDPKGIRSFAARHHLDTILVVEEPGPFVEEGVKSALFGSAVQTVVGERDEQGGTLFPSYGEIDPEVLASLLWPHVRAPGAELLPPVLQEFDRIDARQMPAVPAVVPMSCGGCPYNTFGALSGEKPGGAIGCSSIRAMDAYDNGVLYIPTMGAGGSIYSGTAAFNGNQHIFQYLGDGSYFHSGRGAVQSCVQGGVNITFLLLFNGVVALTGGQRPGGQRSVPDVVRELLSLGVKEVGIVSERYGELHPLLSNEDRVRLYGLDRHETALDHHRCAPGTTALILDKECATEKLRRRRRQMVTPDSYVFIHEEICEGCGDCLQKSEGCAALYGVESDLGDKTQVRQASCVQDELCIEGECPSFLTVYPGRGVRIRRKTPDSIGEIPEPVAKSLDEGETYTIFAVGRGGTGVVTISHLLAYAGMLDGLSVYFSNNTGLAQKGGPVEAPVQFSRGLQPSFNRLLPGGADLLLGFDLLRAAEPQNLRYASPERTVALVSTTRIPTASLNRNPDKRFPDPDMLAELIDSCTAKRGNVYLDSYWLSEQLFGDAIYANILLLGAACQASALPLTVAALEQAIRLNDKDVEQNLLAFLWGRMAVYDPSFIDKRLGRPWADAGERLSQLLDQIAPDSLRDFVDVTLSELDLGAEDQFQVALRIVELYAYQDLDYARRFVTCVSKVRKRERSLGERSGMTVAVARSLHRLMAYKDEYEVARLASLAESKERIQALFDGPVRIGHKLHPPALRYFGFGKFSVGWWGTPLFALLRRLKGLRGTAFDVFGYTACRRLERELVPWFLAVVDELLEVLAPENFQRAVEIAEKAQEIRGYEGVKVMKAEQVRGEVEASLRVFRCG